MHISEGGVAELNGLDAPFVFSELLLQRIWLRGRFERSRAKTLDGLPVQILHPGTWNRLAGPDFKAARIRIGEAEVEGDVELHLQTGDWEAHGHAKDPAYAKVVLHVVLFQPKAGLYSVGHAGVRIPILELLSLLPYDLESFAVDDAAERLAGRSLLDAYEALAQVPPEARKDLLLNQCRHRWEAKISHARLRLDRLGWESACHHGALECLGFRFNRAVMLDIAGRYSFNLWSQGLVDPERLWLQFEPRWRKQGVRPANHPLRRLYQYREWCLKCPSWPELLNHIPLQSDAVSAGEGGHRNAAFTAFRGAINETLCGEVLRGPRFDAFVCDVCLPLLAVLRPKEAAFCEKLWFAWWPGDVSKSDLKVLSGLGLIGSGLQVACNGLRQGLMGWCLDRELRGQGVDFS